MARDDGQDHFQRFMTEHQRAVVPKKAPRLEAPKRTYTKDELNNLIDNEAAGSWRGLKDDPDY